MPMTSKEIALQEAIRIVQEAVREDIQLFRQHLAIEPKTDEQKLKQVSYWHDLAEALIANRWLYRRERPIEYPDEDEEDEEFDG